MEFEKDLSESVISVLACDSDRFNDLVIASGLDPRRDFRFSDLSEVDFSGADLSEFDFSGSDLRRANWRGCVEYPKLLDRAMLGRGSGAVSGRDFERIVEAARGGRTWTQRFFAFSALVDNFGETKVVLKHLREIVGGDKSKYMVFCSFVYFCASFLGSREAMEYCEEVAGGANSRVNLFRFSKVNRYAREFKDFLQEMPNREPKVPLEAQPQEIAAVFPGDRWR